ncbi:capsular biosynthesis protein [Chitinophaga parva]|uniref:non-specific protein-tyrosine kinase n=1 Tax=Chitinophaga parva TaxID=2169414 RepID=A0A2T7BJ07_9BACT|nr:tyrosine-protein kinase [Chitinophaga parva]PUZ26243.1 capsular biosynthesis protein [Chitinophaga parva]
MQENNYINGTPVNGATHHVGTSADSSTDFQQLFDKFTRNWYWFLLSVIVCMAGTWAYLRYVTPDYKINAKILVEDQQKGGDIPGKDVLDELDLFNSKSNVENELEIVKSRTLMENVVRKLQLNVAYFAEGRIKKTEEWGALPFTFHWIYLKDTLNDVQYTVQQTADGKQFHLENKKAGVDKTAHWGDTLHVQEGILQVMRNELVNMANSDYTVSVTSIDKATANYQAALEAAIPNKDVSVINLSLISSIPRKGEQIVNALLDTYQQASIDDKNRIADSTIAFIDNRLQLVSQELSGVEKDIQNFKQQNEVADLQAQSKALVEGTTDFAKQLTDQQVRKSVVESLQQYLADETNNKRVMPSSLIVQDPGFMALVQKYNTLEMERERQMMSSTEHNPVVRNIDEQLAGLRTDLQSNLASLNRGIDVSIAELQRQAGMLTDKIHQVPGKERIYLDFSRQQEVKQELYLFLLKKREESAISKTSNIAIARIVDAGKSEPLPFKPKRPLVYALGLLIGLGLPMGWLYFRDLLNKRINQRTDITSILPVPIIAEIGHSPREAILTVGKNTHTSLAEQFRAMRTNLQFVLAGSGKKVILLTSSMSGEGKSFIAMNLSTIIAMSGKKVVLVEMDLRKPKISERLGLANHVGFSSYVIGQTPLNELLKPSGQHENFWVIPSGPIPPNPAELLLMEKTEALFAYLRAEFDYVIIDSAPIGLVTDAQLLGRYADASLYVVRLGHTFKHQLLFCKDLYLQRKLGNMGLIVNDVKAGSGYSYGYGYGYGYGDAYGYQETNKGIFKRFKKTTSSR